jgi:hypothetical protein
MSPRDEPATADRSTPAQGLMEALAAQFDLALSVGNAALFGVVQTWHAVAKSQTELFEANGRVAGALLLDWHRRIF